MSAASDPSDFELPPESRGDAPGRARMAARLVGVVGAGQSDVGIANPPIGNGRAISLLLAREGARVVAVDCNASAAEATVEQIRSAGGDAAAVIADVADPDQIEEMVARSRAWLGG